MSKIKATKKKKFTTKLRGRIAKKSTKNISIKLKSKKATKSSKAKKAKKSDKDIIVIKYKKVRHRRSIARRKAKSEPGGNGGAWVKNRD